ncbi:hypothetical protein MTR67_017836 [Solanum verrucosum]|uniref:Uncharacterized protein n=1 Tax=Solanum verrucosum TaxID=315347 RepID=A0AAF0QJK7_SOLVR|nr:hypothetical protein MTR67_017836 [Solanum verrucosum]
MKGVMRFGDLAAVHLVFHISLLKKCVGDPSSVVPLETVAVKDSLSYEDVPIEILDRRVRRFRFSASRSRLDRFPIFSSAASVGLLGITFGPRSRVRISRVARGVTGHIRFLDKKQTTVDRLSAEAEYRELASTAAEMA